MPNTPSDFEAKVRSEWLNEATATAWRKWHDKSVRFWGEFTDALVAAARLAPGQHVLDLASGTGDPALDVARRVGPGGRVTATDLAPAMLAIARDNAARAGLHNLAFEIADAHALPFVDGAFDRVTCRLGVMYFWDCGRALGEIRRVLKTGGIASFVAWGPVEENEYMRTALGPFKERRAPPVPPPGAPHPYRFAATGSLTAELNAAGFAKAQDEKRAVRMSWEGPPDELWTRFYEVSAATRPYLDSFTAEELREGAKEATAGFAGYYDGREIVMRTPIVVASGVK